MGHSVDDAVHTIPHKMKMHLQLAESADSFGIGLIQNPL